MTDWNEQEQSSEENLDIPAAGNPVDGEPDPMDAAGDSGSPPILHTNLRSLVDTYYNSQKNRIAWGNRVSALERGVDNEATPQLLQAQSYTDLYLSIEKRAFKEIRLELETYSVWPWMKTVKGIGPTLAGKLLADIDIRKAKHVSNLWSFAGLAVTPEGKSMRPVKGQKLPYSAKLRTACFMVSRSFLMCGSPYLEVYAKAKEFYQRTRGVEYQRRDYAGEIIGDGELLPAWTKGHIDYAARRKMVKVFLQHLWLKWRIAENLPTDLPYVNARWPEHRDGYLGPEYFTPEGVMVEALKKAKVVQDE